MMDMRAMLLMLLFLHIFSSTAALLLRESLVGFLSMIIDYVRRHKLVALTLCVVATQLLCAAYFIAGFLHPLSH